MLVNVNQVAFVGIIVSTNHITAITVLIMALLLSTVCVEVVL